MAIRKLYRLLREYGDPPRATARRWVLDADGECVPFVPGGQPIALRDDYVASLSSMIEEVGEVALPDSVPSAPTLFGDDEEDL